MQDELHAPAFSAWVDAFRWLAAASVLITHTGIRMLVPVTDMPVRSLPHLAYAFLAGFDHYAVMVFFVLSGLLVGGAVVREIRQTGRVAIIRYLQRRIVRLCIVLWPAFLVSAVCIWLAIRWHAVDRQILPPDTTATMALPVLACNMAFLQTALCQQYAENGALWSLFNEFWYYVLFPPMALAVMSARPVWARVALMAGTIAALALLTALQFTGSWVGPYMAIWLIGVWVAASRRPVLSSPLVAAALFVAAALAIRFSVRHTFADLHPYANAGLDVLMSVLFGNMLLSMKCARSLPFPPWPTWHHALAGFSFSLYCTHLSILTLYITVLVAATGLGWQMASTGIMPWICVGGGLALCLAFAWTFSRMTEARTDAARRWLIGSDRALARRAAPAKSG